MRVRTTWCAGLASLEMHGDFEAGELERLLAEGEADVARGDLHDGEEAFREIAKVSAARREGRLWVAMS